MAQTAAHHLFHEVLPACNGAAGKQLFSDVSV
jgi:hypothetical protein